MVDQKDKIDILTEIGGGSFGKVYRCMFRNKERAVKVVIRNNEEFTESNVRAELKILSNVKHPRILNMIHFEKRDLSYYFVLELMKHGSMRDVLKKFKRNGWKFSQNDLLAMFMDIAFGVKYLHRCGIIHRDLKPENVLLDEKHRVKIADFGIAKLIDESGSVAFHTSCGTVNYMAPEVYTHQPYNDSVDVWSLGVMFFEMAMSDRPFQFAEQKRLYNNRLEYLMPIIECKRRNYSEDIQSLLEMMLQRDPRKRKSLPFICDTPIVRKYAIDLMIEEQKFES